MHVKTEHWGRKWQPTPVFLPGDPRDGRAWWAAIYGVTQRIEDNQIKELEAFTNSENSKVSGVNKELQFFNINFAVLVDF